MPRLIALTLLALALLAPCAQAADSHAPRGARLDWLPTSEWVMSSWLPYEEERLYELLDTSRGELASYLDDRRSIGDLARSRGHRSLRKLADELVGGRRALRGRALDTLTQAHLGNHVLFHIFHTPAIAQAARTVFGVAPSEYRRLRALGLTPAAIGARGGRSAAAVRDALGVLLRSRAARAVRLGAMPRAQASVLLARQENELRWYVERPYRTLAQHDAFLCRVRV